MTTVLLILARYAAVAPDVPVDSVLLSEKTVKVVTGTEIEIEIGIGIETVTVVVIATVSETVVVGTEVFPILLPSV